jgi:DNA-binding transcriptional MerR regulator
MPLSRSRDYLSIGEVLETVKEDFPDVSISKIRFLESEGLISPERTPSGYRKFYEPDVDRLRYILALQRDQFLPLKVIRERLDEIESDGGGPPQHAAPAPRSPGKSGRNASTAGGGVEATGVTLNRDELRLAAGLEEDQLKGLVDFGLLDAGSDGSYDENDLLIAKAARGFFEFGVEPRHLRMFRQIADRELGFIEQIVTPVARRRDPEARREADKSTRELVALARRMHDGILRAGLGPTS